MSEPIPHEMQAYYELGLEANRLFHGHGHLELARTQEIILRHLPPPPCAVLDVGGGPGAYACWLAARGYRVTLIDASPLHVKQASEGLTASAAHAHRRVPPGRRETARRGRRQCAGGAALGAALSPDPSRGSPPGAARSLSRPRARRSPLRGRGGSLRVASTWSLRECARRSGVRRHRGPRPARRPASESDRQGLLHDGLLPSSGGAGGGGARGGLRAGRSAGRGGPGLAPPRPRATLGRSRRARAPAPGRTRRRARTHPAGASRAPPRGGRETHLSGPFPLAPRSG